MIRLAGFDLDGTLLTADKKMTPRTETVLKLCAQRGIILVPVTGRPFWGIPKKLLQMEFIRYAISSNGSVTGRVPDGSVIRSALMTGETVQKVLRASRKAAQGGRLIAEVFTGGRGYHDADTQALLEEKYREKPQILDYFHASRVTVPDLPGFLSGKRFENISVMFEDMAGRDEARKRMEHIPGIRVIVPARTDLEIVCRGADKGRALVELARDLKVAREEILAVGDGTNDRELLLSAGTGVAMGNADRALVELADHVAPDNAHDGLAWALEKYALSQEKR